MEKMMRKIGIQMSVIMGITMSLLLSLVGTLSGGHFTVPSWLISFVISLAIALVIGFLVPMRKLGDMACGSLKISPMGLKGTLISAIISDVIYTPVITIVMVVVMLRIAAMHAPAGAVPPVGVVLPGSLAICMVVGYVAIVILQPIYLKLLMKQIPKH